jgi:endonuclease/exonuclease/phosphatase family metal-dependent hydrolase
MSKDKAIMKLICLNTAGGFVRNELRGFITKHAADTDIFCFQEIFDNAHVHTLGDIDQNLYTTITKLLPDHKGYYAPSQDNDEGIAIFIKPSIKLNEVGDVFVHRYLNAMEGEDRRTLGRNLQYIQFAENNQVYTIINVHGLWNGAGKTDTSDRLEQSQKIRDFIVTRATSKVILIGDLNLGPDTKSLAILEENMRNLIKENGITSTRSHYHKWSNKFADYALVSNDVQVIRFEVLQDQVSDHLPLLLEFS